MGSRSGEAHQTGHVHLEGRDRRVYLLYRASAAGVAGQQPTEDVLPHTKQARSRRRGVPTEQGPTMPAAAASTQAAPSSPRSSLYPPSLSSQTSTGDQREYIRPLFVAFAAVIAAPGGREVPCFPLVRLCRLWKYVLGSPPSSLLARKFDRTDPPPWLAPMLLQHSRRGHVSHPLVDTNFLEGNPPHRHHNQGQPWRASTRQGSFWLSIWSFAGPGAVVQMLQLPHPPAHGIAPRLRSSIEVWWRWQRRPSTLRMRAVPKPNLLTE
ncbi:hypothetical protein QBC34DRAFT_23630 [Podospora aff. communis PSN243]|uniref:Uncharacterized protein n=1 Tax=Podospora aff. communis PSN243 TaxID=3040156 RepID=A0AAV9GYC3_9PEZI|nr:hypothetical protein QBC34DRAFT_23630 [Podospora aff. communis PSN243]